MSDENHLLDLIDELKKFESSELYPKGFNIFEIVGMKRQEIKHSNFLSFLLNPNSDHPFGDHLIREVLREAAQRSNAADFSPLNMAIKDYHDLNVKREWQTHSSPRKLDLVMISDTNKEVYVIEVKVGAGESSNQLSDYKNIVENCADFDGLKSDLYILLQIQKCQATIAGQPLIIRL